MSASGSAGNGEATQAEGEVIVKIVVDIDVPNGATHYTGSLLDDPIWFKFTVNSTKVIRVWCYWSPLNDAWMIYGEKPPYFLKEIPQYA